MTVAADAAPADAADVAAASEARAEAEHRSPRARGEARAAARGRGAHAGGARNRGHVGDAAASPGGDGSRAQEASSRLVEAFSSVGKPGSHSGASSSQRTPGSPGPAVLLATESPMPAASPPGAGSKSPRRRASSRAGSKVSGRLWASSSPSSTRTARRATWRRAGRRGREGAQGRVSDPGGGGGGSPTGAFKGWRDSRVLGRGASNKIVKAFHPCFDASDRAVAFATRLMRVSPTARFAGAAYRLMLHVWLVFALVSAKHASGLSGVAEATGVAAAAAP